MLARKEIVKNSRPVEVDKVSTPEWSHEGDKEAHVYVRSLSGTLADELFRLVEKDADNKAKMMAEICILGVCDEGGARHFQDGDLQSLMDGPFAPLKRCSEAVLSFNGFTEEGDEEIAGN